MGDFNQFLWIKNNRNLVEGPILEVGSKFYNPKTSINYRTLFEGIKYTGTDLESGDNVDLVCDITSEFDQLPAEIKLVKFKTIICCSVLEHVDNIFKAAHNLNELLDSGGKMFVSVPFIWEFHGYPFDYWRFTPRAIKYLFPYINFDLFQANTISSNKNYDMESLTDNPNQFLYKEELLSKGNHIEISIIRKIVRLSEFLKNSSFRKEFILKRLFKEERKFPYTSINMIGIKNNG